MSSPCDYTAIVAIDFGTTRSGYHFAFTARPDKIYPNIKWQGAAPEGKTLTEVLLKSDFSLVAFGYEARNKFAGIKDKSDYLYFSNFKMVLHNKEGIVRSMVKATNCDISIPTEKLVAICLGVIKDKAMEQLNSSKTVRIPEEKIRWVITVPAIWDIPARQAMRNAAEKAGIHPNNIIVALEPEAAVLACLENEVEKQGELPVVDNDFMVVDAGGGTVDITVHRNRSEGGLVELHSPSGGAWGSFYINKEFENLLEELLGAEMKNTSAWFQIMDTFEVAKINFLPDDPVGSVCLSPINPKEVVDESLHEAITEYNSRHKIQLEIGRGQMLDFSSFLCQQFELLTSEIATHISTLLAKPALIHVKYLFLVGGFAESSKLRGCIEEKFGHKLKVIVAPSPGISVMRGAVQYGFDPSIIKERIVTQTIGIQHSGLWDDTKHTGRGQAISDNGERYCNEMVHCFVHANDKIPIGYEVLQPCAPSTSRQTSLRIRLFGSAEPTISFISDEGTKLLGYLDLEIPDVGVYSRVVEVILLFGGTTIAVQATYKKTGQSVKATFDFNLDDVPVLLQNMNL